MQSQLPISDKILITGASGYIGGTFALYLKSQGFHPICIDNFSTCRYAHLNGLQFYKIDIMDKEKLATLIKKFQIEHVFHFAAFIEVNESVRDPLKYYWNNVAGSIKLFECCAELQVKNIIFSSTACIYTGTTDSLTEQTPKKPENPYGWTKLFVEQILSDLVASQQISSAICLRYFNVSGSWENKFGPCKAKQQHLIPIVMEKIERKEVVEIFGEDFETRDGSCVRDYIHIGDLCEAHLQAVIWGQNNQNNGKGKCESFNIGTGTGCSVKEVILACKQIVGEFDYKIVNRRLGDPSSLIASVEKIKTIIGWEAKHCLKDIIKDAHQWSLKKQEWVQKEQYEYEQGKLEGMFNAVFFEESQEKIRTFFAPGRINIIGEHTDYTKGFVLPAGIQQGVYILARKNSLKRIRLFGLNVESSEEREQQLDLSQQQFSKQNVWSDYIFACYYKLKEQFPKIQEQGIDLLVFGDLEQSSGLSSSAAIEMASIVMFLGVNGIEIPLQGTEGMIKLSLIAQSAENNYVGVMSGIMDQFASGNALQNSAILLNCLNLESKFVRLELEGYKFILANTNKPRKLIESKYNERVEECKKGLELINQFRKGKKEKEFNFLGEIQIQDFSMEMQDYLKVEDQIIYKRVAHVINENYRVIQLFNLLSQKGQINQIGEFINQSGDSLKTLFEVTGDHLDTLVESARKCKGVVGSRMVGAGFGGCTLNLIKNDEDIIREFKRSVSKDYEDKMKITPKFIEVEIGAGAQELGSK